MLRSNARAMDLCADDSGGFFLFGSLSVSTGFWFPGGVVSGLVGFCVSVLVTSGSLLAVVDNAGLVGAFVGIVSKWSWKVWVVPSSFLRESGRWNGFLSAIWVRSLLHSTVKEFACSLKQVMEMVAVPSLTIAFKQ
ncbi:hypothetical protein Tco_1410325 [Tanacetum coccineum]